MRWGLLYKGVRAALNGVGVVISQVSSYKDHELPGRWETMGTSIVTTHM